MKLIRYNYPEFTDLFSDFDRFFQNSFGEFPALARLAPGVASRALPRAPRLAADLYEDDDNYYTRVELPGAKREDVKVELENSVLTITYEHKADADDSEAVAYTRSLSVPDGASGDKVSAALKDGVLTVTLPRTEEKAPKQIVIICFQKDVVTRSRREMPEYKASWLTSYKQSSIKRSWKPTRDEVVQALKTTSATGLGTNGNLNVIDQDFVDAVREVGREFHVWTVNDVNAARTFQKLKVDSITTDRPAYIRDALRLKSSAD